MADYAPERGPVPVGVDVAHGVIQAEYKGRTNTVASAVAKRLMPHGAAGTPCYRDTVVLPAAASDLLDGVIPLCDLYNRQLMPQQRDLLTITTLRFDDAMPLHVAWRLAVGFADDSFCRRRKQPGILAQHVPALAGRGASKHHVHILALCRSLTAAGATFGGFSDLAQPGAKAVIAAEWTAWLNSNA